MPLEYPTPDTLPADTICRVLFIPNDELLFGAVRGALETLIQAFNWEKLGTITPEEAAESMVDMFDRFCFNEGVCHMIGEIILWSGSDDPNNTNLVLCDGSLVSSDDYPDLWLIIGTTYGGTGAASFALPDLRGKVAIGADGSHSLADTGGTETVTLTTAEMPSHSHTDTGHTHTAEVSTLIAAQTPIIPIPVALPGVGVTGSGSANLTSTGGDGAHNNMQPFLTLRYYIVAL